MKSVLTRVAATVVVLGGAQAQAVTLPPGYQVQAPSPTVAVSVQTSGTPVGNVATQNPSQALIVHVPGPQTIADSSSPGAAAPGNATADGSIQYGPSPNISAHALAQPTGLTPAGVLQAPGIYYGDNYASAGVQLYYFMAISGPTPTVSVNVNALLGVSSSAKLSNANGTASFYVQKQGAGSYIVNDKVTFDSSYPYGNLNVTGDNVSGYVGQYTENGVYSFETGQVYVIGLTARAEVTAYDSSTVLLGPQESSASVDPTFSVASGVPDAGSYQFIFSEGIGNSAPAVPEPSTWGLMIAGLGCLIALRRRRASPYLRSN